MDSATAAPATDASREGNPLLRPSSLAHRAIPFPDIRPEHFLPALERAIEIARGRIETIATSPEPPDFENTIVALELASEEVDRVSSVFYNLLSAETNETLQSIAQTFAPKATNFSSDVLLDPRLFARIKAVWDSRDGLSLSGEQARLLDDSYQAFARNGALLDDKGKAELRRIDERLSELAPAFSDNVLKDTNAFELWIEDEARLSGLPESAREAARAEAEAKGRADAWLFTLHAPSYVPFVTYADDRGLRERVWRAFASRGYRSANDNSALVLETVRLRHERAKLLGKSSHAEFTLERRMAETPQKVEDFLDRLLKAARPAAERDLAAVSEHARANGGPDTLMPWDFAYWAEKLKQARFAFDQEDFRPYLPLDRVVSGLFEHCRRLYSIVFEPSDAYPAWHPDVRVFEVKDEDTGQFIGLFYADFFPRPGKRSGAWMTSLADQGLYRDGLRRPQVGIVCNFTKPTASKPSLLTLDEVTTLFHEMGHALHGLLTRCTYKSLSGTNVWWDFVELPSQVFENWLKERESLDLVARHWQTGESVPADLFERRRAAETYLAGWAALRQVGFGMLDLAWHSGDRSRINDIDAFERDALAPAQVLPWIEGTNVSAAFTHIFAGGYSAGYYSYKWAEVLDADAFELFRERGLFDRATADAFRSNILERGGTEHPMSLYVKFRGREPDPDAMLRRDGLI